MAKRCGSRGQDMNRQWERSSITGACSLCGTCTAGKFGNRILSYLVRLKDAPFYLAMDRNRFNAEVRPQLIEVPIGSQGIAFLRLELDAWADDYASRNGRPGYLKGDRPWAMSKS